MANQLQVRWQLFRRWLIFYRKATTPRKVQQPFLRSLAEALLQDHRWFYAFSDAAGLRDYITQNHQLIPQSEFGAGSQVLRGTQIKVSELGKSAAVDPGNGQLLFKLVNFLQPKILLELGTSLGLSAVYQAAAAQEGRFITIEGAPAIAQLAKKHLSRLKYKNIETYQGRFDQQLPTILSTLTHLDYVYLDGDHRLAPTLGYFASCLPYLRDTSAFVVADIYWSSEMMQAWKKLQDHPKVTASIDFYDFGVLLFRKISGPKAHYSLVPWYWKPWRYGLIIDR